MQKISIAIGLLLSILLLTGSALQAEVDVPWGMIHQDAIDKSVVKLKELLLPFGAQAGFPDSRPVGMENASYEELYKLAAARSLEGSKLFADMIEKLSFPTRLKLGAKYFMKRLEIGSQLFPEKAGNERVFEFLCRDFAAACDRGFEELRFWAVAEGVFTMDYLWFENIRKGLDMVKSKMPVISEDLTAETAREAWKKAASALVAAGNEAGLASAKVGAFQFPAWRLEYAVKYFKAASKASVIELWHSRNSDPQFWLKNCKKLRAAIAEMNAEIDSFLATLK